jgi:hypothetical protein
MIMASSFSRAIKFVSREVPPKTNWAELPAQNDIEALLRSDSKIQLEGYESISALQQKSSKSVEVQVKKVSKKLAIVS